MTLTLPAVVDGADPSALAPFPILGPGKIVWIVTSRYVMNDIVIWTSTNGGASFGAPHNIPSGQVCLTGASCENSEPYTNMTGLDDTVAVTPSGDAYNGQTFLDGAGQPYGTFVQSSTNPGLGFDWTGTDVQYVFADGEFSFSDAAPFIDIESSALGVTSNGEAVEAYTDDEPAIESVQYLAYAQSSAYPSLLIANQTPWAGPTTLAHSYGPRLADGADGLFMVVGDDPTGDGGTVELYPWNQTTRTFGAPHRVAGISDSGVDGGLAENASTGELVTVWPVQDANGNNFMDAYVSTNGGKSSSSAIEVATVGDSHRSPGEARVAVSPSGTGFVTFVDERGLEVADLEPRAQQYAGLRLLHGVLDVPFTCTAPAHGCTAQLTLTLKHVTVHASYRIGPGATRTLVLRPSRAMLRVIPAHRSVTGALTMKITWPGAAAEALTASPKL